MFNETSYFGDKPIQGGGPCAAGETAVDVGADTNICMSQSDRDAWLGSLVGAVGQTDKPTYPFGSGDSFASSVAWGTVVPIAIGVFFLFAYFQRR